MMLPFTRRLFPVARQLRLYSTHPAAAADLLEGEQTIHAKLTEKFSPTQLQVQMFPVRGCGSFYAITIASEAFKGLTTLKQHKLVTETLKKEIEGIHGLQIKTTVV
ncbi:bola protein [Mucidula mucida]|nr:bola protein [Mucidula mucida]